MVHLINLQMTYTPEYHYFSSDLDTIENELKRSAKEHHSTKKNRYIMNLLEQINESVISGSEDLQPSSLECTGTAQKYIGTSMDEFFDSHPLPTNWEDVECLSTGRKFHFLYSLNPLTVKSEAADSLSYANRFWKIPDISNQLKRFFDNWAYDRKFNS